MKFRRFGQLLAASTVTAVALSGTPADPTPGKWTHRGLAMLLWSV